MANGQNLGCNFTYQQQQRYHNDQVGPFVFGAEYSYHNGGGNDRGSHIDQFVADQDGNDQSAGLAEQFLDKADSGMLILAHLLQLHTAQGKE